MIRRRDFLATAAALPLAGCIGSGDAAPPAHPPIGDFIEVAGVRLHYIDEGAGPSPGPTIVLIHGASGNLRDWTFSMTARLRDRFRVIAIDRPGHGYSGRLAKDGADPAAQARLFAAATAALGAGRVLIAGHSWGGALAAAWALERPDQVAGAAIIAGATYPWGGDGGLLYRLGAGELSPAVGALARLYAAGEGDEDLIADIFAPDPVIPGYADYIGVELALRPDTFRWNAADIYGLNDNLARISPRYGELAMPLEVIHGDADEIVGLEVHSIPLSRTARNARLTVLPGVGHMPHHVREDETVAAFDRLAAASFG